MQAEKEKLRIVAAPDGENCTGNPDGTAVTPPADSACPDSSAEPASAESADCATLCVPADVHSEAVEESSADVGAAPAPPVDDQLIGTLIEQRYRVESLRDANDLRKVYGAIDETTGKPVLIYVYNGRYTVDSRDYHHFKIWMSQVAQMTHEELVQAHGFLNETTAYAVTEAVEGTSLKEKIQLEGIMPVSKAVPLFVKVCKLLQSFHARNIAHDNLSLDNIVLVPNDDDTDVLKLRAFALLDCYSPASKKQDKVWVGQNDVKALAEALYEAICNQPDFAGLKPTTSYEMPVRSCSLPRQMALPLELQSILLKAMHKDPARRHRSILRLARDLNTFSREWVWIIQHGSRLTTYATVLAVLVGLSFAWLEHTMHISSTVGGMLPVHRIGDLSPAAQTALSSYSNDMYKKIAGNLPLGANLDGASKIEMRVLIAPDGSIAQTKLLHSSGNRDVDKEAVAAVLRSQFLPTPPFLNGRNLGMIFWFDRVMQDYNSMQNASEKAQPGENFQPATFPPDHIGRSAE